MEGVSTEGLYSWVERKDPETGRLFYYNLDTKVSTYTVPPRVLHGDWEVMQDPVSNRIFYYNRKRNRSQWEKPLDSFVPPGKSERMWQEVWDEELQRKFWFNQSTGEASWVRPLSRESRESVASSVIELEEQTNGVWRVMRDTATDRVFYYNVSTGGSQWERPEDFVPVNRRESVTSRADPAYIWEKLKDPQTGRVFFFNRDEGTAQWERPIELGGPVNAVVANGPQLQPVVEESPVQDTQPDEQALEQTDKGSAPEEQVDVEQEKEEEEEEAKKPNPAPSQAVLRSHAASASTVPGRLEEEQDSVWEEIFDPQTERKFYYNRAEGTSQWERPPTLSMSSISDKNSANHDTTTSSHEDYAETESTIPSVDPPSMENAESPRRKATRTDSQVDITDGKQRQSQRVDMAQEKEVEGKEMEDTDNVEAKETSEEAKEVEDTNDADAKETSEEGNETADSSDAETKALEEAGWKELIDANTGQKYYFSTKTGESQWIHPLKTKAVDQVWCEMFDEKTKRPYFYNRLTGESRRERPAEDHVSESTTTLDSSPPLPIFATQDDNQEEPGRGEEEDVEQDPNEQRKVTSTADAIVEVDYDTSPKEPVSKEMKDRSTSSSELNTATDKTSNVPVITTSTKDRATSSSDLPPLPELPAQSSSATEEMQVIQEERETTSTSPVETESSTWAFFSEKYAKLIKGERNARQAAAEEIQASTQPPTTAATTTAVSTQGTAGEGKARRASFNFYSPFDDDDMSPAREDNISDDGESIEFIAPPRHPPPTSSTTSTSRAIPDELHPDRVFSSLGEGQRKASLSINPSLPTQVHDLPFSPMTLGAEEDRFVPPPMYSTSSNQSSYLGSPSADATSFDRRFSQAVGKSAIVQEPQMNPLYTTPQDPPLSGFLEKRARHGRQQWQKRWFVLDNLSLRYYQTERVSRDRGMEDVQPLAKIDLSQVKAVEAGPDTEFSVRGKGTIGILCVLRAANEADRVTWMNRISQSAKLAEKKKQALSSTATAHRRSHRVASESTRFSSDSHASETMEREVVGRTKTSFVATEPGMLSYSRGEIVRVIRRPVNDTWWVGECQGRVGRFLAANITLLPSTASLPSTGFLGKSLADAASELTEVSEKGDDKGDDETVSLVSRQVSESFSEVEKRIDFRKKRERLEHLINALGIEPLKRLETYPTESALDSQREKLRELNIRNHKLKAEIRGLQWKLYNQLDEGGFHDDLVSTHDEEGPHAYLLVSYSKMLGVLQKSPHLLVQIGANLKLEAQYVFASTLANSLFDQYSVPEEMFQGVVQAAVEMLWDQGLPSLDLMRRQRVEADHGESSSQNPASTSILKEGSGETQPLLPSLLVAFVQRNECRQYLDRLLHSIRDDFCDILLSVGDTGVKLHELSSLLVDAASSDAGLDLIPPSVCRIGALLFEVGGQATLHRFLFDVLLVPALFDPRFLPDEDDLVDPVLVRRMHSRLDQLAEFLCVDIPQAQQRLVGLNRQHHQVSVGVKMLIRLVDKLSRKVIEDGQSVEPLKPTKPAQLCDLAVLSCFELYMVHLAVVSYTRRFPNKQLPAGLVDALHELGEPRPLPDVQNRNPYLVLRLPTELKSEDHRPLGLGQDLLNALIRARSKIDSLHESWNPVRDGQLLDVVEAGFEKANTSMLEQKRLRIGFETAQKYYGELALQKERLMAKVQVVAFSPRRMSPRRRLSSPESSQFGGGVQEAGLVASVPMPRHTPIQQVRRKFSDDGSSSSSLSSTPHTSSTAATAGAVSHTVDTSPLVDLTTGVSSSRPRMPQRSPPPPVHSDSDEGDSASGEHLDGRGNGHAFGMNGYHYKSNTNSKNPPPLSAIPDDDSNPLATLLATVFSPLKLQPDRPLD